MRPPHRETRGERLRHAACLVADIGCARSDYRASIAEHYAHAAFVASTIRAAPTLRWRFLSSRRICTMRNCRGIASLLRPDTHRAACSARRSGWPTWSRRRSRRLPRTLLKSSGIAWYGRRRHRGARGDRVSSRLKQLALGRREPV